MERFAQAWLSRKGICGSIRVSLLLSENRTTRKVIPVFQRDMEAAARLDSMSILDEDVLCYTRGALA